MAATVQGDKKADLVGGSPFDLSSAQAGQRKSRVPEILVGTFLIALFALGGAWFYSTSTDSTAYAVLRQPVARGDVLDSEDLAVAQISTDDQLSLVPWAGSTEIVGRVALVDMEPGTLVSAAHFSDLALIPPGAGVVGLNLGLGEFPSFNLAPGDRVRVVVLPDERGGAAEPPVVLDSVEVLEVAEVGTNSRLISLVMSTADADTVAVAHASDRVRLIQVAGEGSN